MPLSRRAVQDLRKFDMPLSYRADEPDNKYKDIRNMFFNQGKLETRHGYSRFNATTLGGSVLSLSYFKENDGTDNVLAKVGTTLYKVNTTGAATAIKTGLSATTVHRGLTHNNRHIISIETDGLFSWDGTTFSQLGQEVPNAPTVGTSGSGHNITTGDWAVGITYYASSIGFESNVRTSTTVTVAGTEQIDVTSIPTTAANAFVDKVRIYLKDVTNAGLFFFIEEISLGTATATITDESSSTQTPPTVNGAPIAGGGRFMTVFNRKLVYSGNNVNKSDVFFSETDLPDGFNATGTRLLLVAESNGPVTGLATGFFNDGVLDPFLVVFKENSIHVYSEVGGQPRFTTINDKIGCVSHNTISVKDGAIFFLSKSGWRAISNGKLVNDKNKPATLGFGDIDDIFTSEGFVFELNKSDYSTFFSVYYSHLDQYMTWTSEGSSNLKTKTYCWEFSTGGFKPYEFNIAATAAVVAQDESDDREIVLFSDANGFIYKHSTEEPRDDVDSNNSSVSISTFALLPWFGGTQDYDATYSFRELIVRAVGSANDVTVRTFVNYDQSNENLYTYSFPTPTSGFILDISKLDEGTFGDDRVIVTARADLNVTGENILIGFYQDIASANINLVNAQLHYNKNGNRNLS